MEVNFLSLVRHKLASNMGTTALEVWCFGLLSSATGGNFYLDLIGTSVVGMKANIDSFIKMWQILPFLPLLASSTLPKPSRNESIVILHPFYSGSHVLTLHSVAEKLVQRGHKVSQVDHQVINQLIQGADR